MNLGLMLLAISASCSSAVQRTDASRRFRVEVPPSVESEQTHLLVKKLVVARNVPLILRFYAEESAGSKIYLGSTAVPAAAEDAAGVASIAMLRINVTDGVRRWYRAAKDKHTAIIVIEASRGGGLPAPSESWSIGELQLVHPSGARKESDIAG
jgi:hypothetical protein